MMTTGAFGGGYRVSEREALKCGAFTHVIVHDVLSLFMKLVVPCNGEIEDTTNSDGNGFKICF